MFDTTDLKIIFDKDGLMKGCDAGLIERVRKNTAIPVTVIGEAGSIVYSRSNRKKWIIRAAAGSLFVFKGPYKAVLINCPNSHQKNIIYKKVYNENKA